MRSGRGLCNEPSCIGLFERLGAGRRRIRNQKPRPVSPKNGETRTGHPRARGGLAGDGHHEKEIETEGPEGCELGAFSMAAGGVVLLGSDPGEIRNQKPRPVSPKNGETRTGHPRARGGLAGDGHHEKEIETEGPEDHELGAFEVAAGDVVLLGSDPGEIRNQKPRPVSPKNGETRTGHPHARGGLAGDGPDLIQDDGHHEKGIEAEGPEDYELGTF